MAQTIKDFITSPSSTPQVITTDAVSEVVNQFPSSPQQIGLKDMRYEFVVGVAAAGMASGINLQIRADTAAGLASGSQLILGERPAVLPADLTVGAKFEIVIPSQLLPANYVYIGAYYDLVNEAASGGFAMYCSLKQGGVSEVV